jgi:hypothetical protein
LANLAFSILPLDSSCCFAIVVDEKARAKPPSIRESRNRESALSSALSHAHPRPPRQAQRGRDFINGFLRERPEAFRFVNPDDASLLPLREKVAAEG